jgi:hypothetical protein
MVYGVVCFESFGKAHKCTNTVFLLYPVQAIFTNNSAIYYNILHKAFSVYLDQHSTYIHYARMRQTILCALRCSVPPWLKYSWYIWKRRRVLTCILASIGFSV